MGNYPKYTNKPPSKQGEQLYTLAALIQQARRQIASDPRHAHRHQRILQVFLELHRRDQGVSV